MYFRPVATLCCLLFYAQAAAAGELPFRVETIADFDEPWALAFLPDGRMLVTEKKGNLLIVSQNGEKSRPMSGVPDVDYGGQGGLGDVALHPNFAQNQTIYLSYAEAGAGNTRGRDCAQTHPILQPLVKLTREQEKWITVHAPALRRTRMTRALAR